VIYGIIQEARGSTFTSKDELMTSECLQVPLKITTTKNVFLCPLERVSSSVIKRHDLRGEIICDLRFLNDNDSDEDDERPDGVRVKGDDPWHISDKKVDEL
jgi:hypothetical protein